MGKAVRAGHSAETTSKQRPHGDEGVMLAGVCATGFLTEKRAKALW